MWVSVNFTVHSHKMHMQIIICDKIEFYYREII